MVQPSASECQNAPSAYAEFLRITRAMREALTGNDAEGFCSLVEQRDGIVATIGPQAPTTVEDKRCLYEAAKLSGEIDTLVAKLWGALMGDIQQLAAGRKAANAYYRSMSRRSHEDNSKFIDKTK